MKKRFAVMSVAAALTVSMCGTSFASGRVLEQGDTGDDVSSLQEALWNLGYFDEEITGYFGDITLQALLDFQNDYGLEADGLAGPITTSYLGVTTNSEDEESDEDDSDDGYSYTGSFTRALKYDMEGDDVYSLQILLQEAGFFESYPTGYFGELTEAAVMDFQEFYGLEVDGIAGSITIGVLTGTEYDNDDSYSMDDYISAVLAAVDSTPATSSGYCAAWVTQVMTNAGILTYDINELRPTYYSYAVEAGLTDSWYSDSTGFNANDYWAYVCYSDDLDDLQPGMIVATRSSFTYLGQQFGHVGIYIGDGQVVSSVGYLETLSLETWEARYNNTDAGSTIAWGYLPR